VDAKSNRGGPGDDREERGRRALQRLRAVTVLFDQAFAIPGTRWRFGIDALFGLIPGLGDIAGAVVAVYALHVARALGAPQVVQVRMLGNIALDALVGTVPVLGDLFDFAFKAQTRNLKLLDAYLATPQLTGRRSRRGLILISIAIAIVFATLTALGIWMLYMLFRWLGALFTGL
jgi:hypothetical protein